MINNILNVSTSPHVRQNVSTKNIMLDVVIALLPTTIFGIYRFGIESLILILTTVVSSILFEWLFCKIMNKKQTVGDFSAVVTGLILALNFPSNLPLWMGIVGAFFAIVVVKELFGGLGQNFMNPALAGRCFLIISFTSKMTAFHIDGVSSPTPLFIIKNSDMISNVFNQNMVEGTRALSYMDSFIGNIPGTIGEVSKICLLLGAVYLLFKKVISLRIPFFYILTVCICMFLFGKFPHNIDYVLLEVLNGGLIFGAFFMATDYVTTPITKKGQIIFAIIIGILTSIFRIFGQAAEGVSYAIILGNLLVPIIEKMTYPKAFGLEGKSNE